MAGPLFFYLFLWTMTLEHGVLAAPSPFAMTWSSLEFGPDGPWQAVEVTIGTPGVPIRLYPGNQFWSHLLSPNVCNNASLGSACYITEAGVYIDSDSSTSGFGQMSLGASSEGVDFSGGALQLHGSTPNSTFDNINIGNNMVIPNVSIGLHQDIYATLPDGTAYPIEVGSFSLGAPGIVNQSFGTQPGEPLLNTSMVSGWLWGELGQTASSSWGLHIGSVAQKVSPSLYFGGYDQNRVLGPVSMQLGNPVGGVISERTGGTIDLIDIGINVVDGASPWSFASKTGLLASGNSSIGSDLPVGINPLAPYLYLPQSTCDAIAAFLPVTYQAKYGIYFWNTSDPLYTKIVTSASALSFVFRLNQTNAHTLTVNVPFLLLNLTLQAPLTTSPTPYFPCQTQIGPWQLGRAFLQAAFFGANWNANNNQTAWFLAQAPGPNIPSSQVPVSIGLNDEWIQASTNDWATSWSGIWTPLPQTNNTVNATTTISSTLSTATSTSSSTPNQEKASPSASSSGMSTGVKAGIATGSAVGFCLIGIGIILICLRVRKAEDMRGNIKSMRSDQPMLPDDTYARKELETVERPDLKPAVEMNGLPGYGQQNSELGPAELL